MKTTGEGERSRDENAKNKNRVWNTTKGIAETVDDDAEEDAENTSPSRSSSEVLLSTSSSMTITPVITQSFALPQVQAAL